MISILYVDDEQCLLDLTKRFLEKDPEMQVDTVISAAEALEKIKSRPYDIIVSDYQMPDMDGIAFLKILKTRGTTTPFILYTGRGREEVVIEAINNGATFYLQKGGGVKAQYAELAHKIRLAVEKKRAEQALLVSEELHRTIFETVPEGITLMDARGTITYASPAALSLFGLADHDEAAGTSIFDWIAPGARDEVRARVLNYIASGMQPVYAGLFPVQKKDGTPFFAEISSAVLFDSEKKPRGMISIFRDVTDRIIQEEALSRSNAKLNLLAAVTRHDILNKITALMAHIELSRQSCDLESMQAGLAKIDSIAGMLEEQIEFTRDYQDLGVKSPAWQNLAKVCSHAASQLDMGSVRFVNEAANLEVYADPLFEKVVCNIIDNALRHGGGISTIRVWFGSDNGNSTLSIEDNGVGIPAPDKSRIFDKGFGSHTGYGLFLAREILAITGMSIRETGVPGNGARFDVLVPKGKFRIRPVS